MKMRRIDYIVIHCAATKPNMDVGVSEIRGWHRQRGFSDVGYHRVIRRDGTYRPRGGSAISVAEHDQILALISEGSDPREIELAARYHALRSMRDFIASRPESRSHAIA